MHIIQMLNKKISTTVWCSWSCPRGSKRTAFILREKPLLNLPSSFSWHYGTAIMLPSLPSRELICDLLVCGVFHRIAKWLLGSPRVVEHSAFDNVKLDNRLRQVYSFSSTWSWLQELCLLLQKWQHWCTMSSWGTNPSNQELQLSRCCNWISMVNAPINCSSFVGYINVLDHPRFCVFHHMAYSTQELQNCKYSQALAIAGRVKSLVPTELLW